MVRVVFMVFKFEARPGIGTDRGHPPAKEQVTGRMLEGSWITLLIVACTKAQCTYFPSSNAN